MAPSKAALSASSRVQKTTKKGLSQELLKRISAHASGEIAKQFDSSGVFSNVEKSIAAVPKFSVKELKNGKVLGRGQFGVVFEIASVNLTEDEEGISLQEGRDDEEVDKARKEYFDRRRTSAVVDKYEKENREFIAKHCIREDGNARYACKVLSDEVLSDANTFYQAAKDLAIETHFLSTVEHPNIIKMRGIAMGDMCSKGYFIVMDRLYDTLESRLAKWKREDTKLKGLKGKLLDRKGTKKGNLIDRRLTVGFDLAAALEHLHSQSIVHRDLKPENIGFDVRGDVKIFDFGLATELRPDKKAEGGLYNLTGETGSLRYMAPEVYKGDPYNDRADVYSFAVLLWQIIHLNPPYARYNKSLMRRQVYDAGVRPKISSEFCSSRLQILLRRSWAQNIGERMSSANAKEILKKELITLRHEGDEDCLDQAHMRRRSTYVAPRVRQFLSSRTL